MDKPNMRIISATVSDRGLSDKRPVNEDSYLEIPEKGLFAVADGVGGAQAGDFASQTAMEVLQEAFAHPRPNFDAEDLLEIAIQRANESIYQMSHELPQLEMMATTIVALHLNGDVATIGHVGDSRLYRLDPAGNLYRETDDHSVVEEEVRAGRMTLAQAANHPSRNVISRALGADPGVEVEMRTIMFAPGTTFLLCSDGVTRHIQDHELKNILLTHDNLNYVCGEIKTLCYQRGAEDNLTAVVVRVEDASIPVTIVDDEDQNTFIGNRPVFAPNPLPTLSNGAPRGASSTDERTAEFASMSIVNPDATTAPLDASALQATEPPSSTAASMLTPASQTLGATESTSPTEPTIQDKIDNERIRAKIDAADAPAFSAYAAPEEPRRSSGLVTSLLMLLIGAAIGAGLFYAYSLMNPPQTIAPTTTVNQNTSPAPALPDTGSLTKQEINEFQTFEKVRRSYDAQPRTAANAAPPQTAADYYLQGRAFLQIGEYDNARQALNKAAEQLQQSADGVNPETLRVDIAVAQAAVGAMTQTASDRRTLSELVKTKQGTNTDAPNANTSASPTFTP
jgi:PPM family protein phosphatase